jgi:hypothetical protein
MYYVCYNQFSGTHFSAIDILGDLTPLLLKRTAIKYFENDHAYKMSGLYLKF